MSSPNNNDAFKLSELFNVKDKVVVVSGGGSGIGLMATQAFAVNGAKVYIIGRTKEKLDRVAEIYGKDIPGQIIPIQGDISKKESIAAMVKEIESKEKCVCILVNNAGVSSNTMQTEAKTAEEMKANLFDNPDSNIEDWTDTYKTNVPQCFFMTMGFLPLLQKASEHQHGFSGCVINVCSISGIVKTAQHHFAYNASKAAVIHLTKMLGFEIGNNGLKVRVNSIAPGVFPSEMTQGESGENQKSELPKEDFEGKVFAQRPGNDRDMGNAMLFVASNQYLNGQAVVIDGGYVLQHGSA
ncbi:NAD(P)-binding protein [Aureobasidium pullulans]|nr:NAD(P)-binding protein [Aureobasidium pullulans]